MLYVELRPQLSAELKAQKGPLAGVFIYGDLQTKQILRWTSPAGIKPGDSMEFVWVETP